MTAAIAPRTMKKIAELMSQLPDAQRDPNSIFRVLENSHASILESERRELFRIAITSIVQGVSRRRGRADKVDENQQDFWRQNSLRSAIAVSDKSGKLIRKRPYNATVHELENYVLAHSNPKPAFSKGVKEIAMLLERIKPYVTSSDDLVSDCWQRRRAAA